jgi:NADPH-dependent ferric siderophore reductase
MAKTPMRPVRTRPEPPLLFFRTQVTHVTRVTPNIVRVTLGGNELAEFVADGPDQRIKVFLPPPGETEPKLPTYGDDWYAVYRQLPAHQRPAMRTYTVRRHYPERNEVDVDFVLHGDIGPASRWASRAALGDQVLIWGPYADYEPTPNTSWQLIAGDATALPAVGAILEQLPAGTVAKVFLEVDSPADQLALETAGDVTVTWADRSAGESVVELVRAAALPDGSPYVWMGGEAGLIKALRRHCVNERRYPRYDIYFCGYWRRGRAEDQFDDAEAEAEEREELAADAAAGVV